LTLSDEQIIGLIKDQEKESKALKDETIRISWYMRGGISYDDAMMLSSEDREIIGKLIKENLEVTKKSGIPFF
jgi:hypothetical protein